ncbi:MAG: PEP-CTERM sorting domain-containing protein [Phycisphaeraceae bacterium]|nr:PEP-CTERM sorting domain-containing protein [Phycisphaeraceae bacterium]
MFKVSVWAGAILLGSASAGLAQDHVLVGSWADDVIYRYDAVTGDLLQVNPIEGPWNMYGVRGIGLGDHGILFASAPNKIYRINARTGHILSETLVPFHGALFYDFLPRPDGTILGTNFGTWEIDQNTGHFLSRPFVLNQSFGLAPLRGYDFGGLISHRGTNSISRWGNDLGSSTIIPFDDQWVLDGDGTYSISDNAMRVEVTADADFHSTVTLKRTIPTFDIGNTLRATFVGGASNSMFEVLVDGELVFERQNSFSLWPGIDAHGIAPGNRDVELKLRLTAAPGTSAGVEVSNTGGISHTSTVERGFITNRPDSPDANEQMGLNNIYNIRIGPDKLLYVASQDNHQILRYDPLTGEFIDVFVGPDLNEPDAEPDWLRSPQFMSFAPDGSLFVTSNHEGLIYHIAPDGSLIKTFGSHDHPAFIQYYSREITITNGAFLSGGLDPWYVVSGSVEIIEDPDNPGEFVASMTANSEAGLGIHVDTLADDFFLSFLYRIPDPVSGWLDVWLDEQLLASIDLSEITSNQWLEDHLKVLDPSLFALTDAELEFILRDASPGATVWLNDVDITSAAIPEPGTLAVLGLAGIAALYRRPQRRTR